MSASESERKLWFTSDDVIRGEKPREASAEMQTKPKESAVFLVSVRPFEKKLEAEFIVIVADEMGVGPAGELWFQNKDECVHQVFSPGTWIACRRKA